MLKLKWWIVHPSLPLCCWYSCSICNILVNLWNIHNKYVLTWIFGYVICVITIVCNCFAAKIERDFREFQYFTVTQRTEFLFLCVTMLLYSTFNNKWVVCKQINLCPNGHYSTKYVLCQDTQIHIFNVTVLYKNNTWSCFYLECPCFGRDYTSNDEHT